MMFEWTLFFVRLSFNGKTKKRKGQSLWSRLCILRVSKNIALLNSDIDGEDSITKIFFLYNQLNTDYSSSVSWKHMYSIIGFSF